MVVVVMTVWMGERRRKGDQICRVRRVATRNLRVKWFPFGASVLDINHITCKLNCGWRYGLRKHLVAHSFIT